MEVEVESGLEPIATPSALMSLIPVGEVSVPQGR